MPYTLVEVASKSKVYILVSIQANDTELFCFYQIHLHHGHLGTFREPFSELCQLIRCTFSCMT